MINSLKSKKAAGVDDISPYFLQLLSNILTPALSFIINHCLSLWVFFQKLKIAKVIPIHKSGPTDKIESYRPIFLLSLHDITSTTLTIEYGVPKESILGSLLFLSTYDLFNSLVTTP